MAVRTTAKLGLLPDREKAKRADFTYVNTGTPDQLDAWVAEVLATLVAAS